MADHTPESSTQQRTDPVSVFSWALWDCGSAAFHAVLVTFIFSVYLVDSVGLHVSGPFTASQWYSATMAAAGVAIALVTPVIGHRADEKGTRKRSVVIWTTVTALIMASLFFVRNTSVEYFWLGTFLIGMGAITIQFGEVSYFAMINQVSTKETVGRVSGFGWAAGYIGGIVLLLLCYAGFVAGDGDTRGFLNLPIEEGFNIRLVAIFAALWLFGFALPLMFRIPEKQATNPEFNDSFVQSYKRLFDDIRVLWTTNKNGLYFLAASAIFRDGLSGVFAFGAILGVSVYGVPTDEILLFGVAANIAAALGSIIGGLFDDRVGPKIIIMVSLISMIVTGFIMLFAEGPASFWVLGLILCLFVGPAQSSSRSFIARVSPPGKEGEMFGLYTTTGRAVSWLTPLLFATFIGIAGADDRAGIIGIVMVLLIGAILIIPVRDPVRTEQADSGDINQPIKFD
ncbi:MFS transporter [Corynebacterium breve]|uniref:MFS transporter n=1 Tax=Corynebacterium breve TaxID=3049799 RepID=A0ABY8VFB7_9CORY|nr:MFS transporter [Corynebacterium breve]WIM67328.1 MFS transporter [Corynebacterium breve]